MKIIICGAGRVGFGIASSLVRENNDVVVIEQEPSLVQSIAEQLDVRAIEGHGAHPDVLERAGARDADMLIAVTFYDEVNMVACQVAHSLFDLPMRVARVRSQSYLDTAWSTLFTREHMPIDVIISPEREVARSVLRRLEVPGAFETLDFAGGAVQVVGTRINENCPVINTPLGQLADLFPGLQADIVGITRAGRTFVPKPEDQLLVGDDVFFVAGREHVRRSLEILGHEDQEARRVILVGGGNIGVSVAQSLEKGASPVRVKLLEADQKRAEHAADQLERTIVLLGDGLDHLLLREAGVEETETLVSLTNDDEVNILSAVIAKREGAGRVLALINNQVYGPLIDSLGIDAFIDPRAVTVSTILQHVRRGRIKALHAVQGGAAEAIEAEALETSPLVGRPLGEVGLPSGIAIGAVSRDGTIHRPKADFEIETGDHVIIFAEAEAIKKVEQLFRVSLEYF
jgi:trk system potassium uptake protein TrkA